MFREGISAEFLVNGLIKHEDGTLEMPAKGCVTPAEIDEISKCRYSGLSSQHYPELDSFIRYSLTILQALYNYAKKSDTHLPIKSSAPRMIYLPSTT